MQSDLALLLSLPALSLRIFKRYDILTLHEADWPAVMHTVLSEPASDHCHADELPELPDDTRLLYVEPLPGQFDIRAESCGQCIQMLLGGAMPKVQTATVYAIQGADDPGFARIRDYLINPVECREAHPGPQAHDLEPQAHDDIPTLHGFTTLDDAALETLRQALALSMSFADLAMTREYFREQQRDPTLSELRVLDTYWSDHCRHTTFHTELEVASIEDPRVEEQGCHCGPSAQRKMDPQSPTGIHDPRVAKAYRQFKSINPNKPTTLMNIATAAMRHLRSQGKLPLLDTSDETNACTIKVNVDGEPWLIFFKNETHNHPTEIEPYGGASTCIGGAIRDPLSGRSYVYQAMRISGAGDPRAALADTLPGKLPQRQLTQTAAQGFSAYGNQIGLATGYVRELYHEGYVAKRLETGAVVGAAPLSAIRREQPANGDVVLLLGGRTGRDGIGGATGSSKAHKAQTVAECAAEVQKGNAPEERKLQRLFREPFVTALIKRCNDFGAGGVSVAIGELADGVEIDLSAIPTKYSGLDGTELALSESQERMAVVVAAEDTDKMIAHARRENVEATPVARITDDRKLVMMWRGQKIVELERAFLDKNGARRKAAVYVGNNNCRDERPTRPLSVDETYLKTLCADLNFCSQKGLVERFDASIGAGSVFSPHGGRLALTGTQVMAALLPGENMQTATVMAYGGDPWLCAADPFGGAAQALITSVAKLVAVGVPYNTIHLSLQEYFPRPDDDPARWGLPFAAMLGAFSAQMGLGVAAIGGKDSMSGSFDELDVPPTLISFALGVAAADDLISPEFKAAGQPVYLLTAPATAAGEPDYPAIRLAWAAYAALFAKKAPLSAWAVETGGLPGGIMKMALGNMIGFVAAPDFIPAASSPPGWGSIIFTTVAKLSADDFSTQAQAASPLRLLGYTTDKPCLDFGGQPLSLSGLRSAWEMPLEGVFPVKKEQPGTAPRIEPSPKATPEQGQKWFCTHAPHAEKHPRPRAIIPVFPGTNCEYDTVRALERAGGLAQTILIRNLSPQDLSESIAELEKAINAAQMLIFPGGFSGGDEPDGSAKFIVSLFRNERLIEAVHALLNERGGLILGICNGFQALIKLGLLPYGRIAPMGVGDATLTHNSIGRHQAQFIRTRVSSFLSPWLSRCAADTIYVQPISHGEGRLVASDGALDEWREKGQIAFQYVDYSGLPSMDIQHNPNGSAWAIEGLCSPDGRILGKMAHTERWGEQLAKNIPGEKFLPLFEGGVGYYM